MRDSCGTRIMCGNVFRKFSPFYFAIIGIMLQSHPSNNVHLIHGYYTIEMGDRETFFFHFSRFIIFFYSNLLSHIFIIKVLLSFFFRRIFNSVSYLYTFAFIVKFIVCLMRQFVVVLNVHNVHIYIVNSWGCDRIYFIYP